MSYKSDFPIFTQTVHGKPLTYLDSAASAQKPHFVIDAMDEVAYHHYANIHRGLYEFSQDTTLAFEQARAKIYKFIGADKVVDKSVGNTENSPVPFVFPGSTAQNSVGTPDNLIFTKNATEAINLVAYSWGEDNLAKGDVIILTRAEHHANIIPWQLLQERKSFEIKVLDVDSYGRVNLNELHDLLDERVKLVSFSAMSNALGVVHPIANMTKIVKEFNPEIRILIDMSQYIVHNPVDISVDFGSYMPDFIAFTGHKLYGPTGIGVLWAQKQMLSTMRPFLGGGDMIDDVDFAGSSFKTMAQRFEAGTPPIIEAIGLGAACDYMSGIGMTRIHDHEMALFEKAYRKICELDEIVLYGLSRDGVVPDDHGAIISFGIKGADIADIGVLLDQQGVAVRAGHHCCMPLMKHLGVAGTVRASFGIYNDDGDVERFVEAVKKAITMLT